MPERRNRLDKLPRRIHNLGIWPDQLRTGRRLLKLHFRGIRLHRRRS